MKSRYWRRNACQPDSFFFAASSFAPYARRALLHLGGGQPLGRVDRQPARHLVDRDGMPGDVACDGSDNAVVIVRSMSCVPGPPKR